MKYIKVLSYVGILWVIYCIVIMLMGKTPDTAGWGIIGLVFCLPFFIGTSLLLKRYDCSPEGKLNCVKFLKEKGIITDDEFSSNKNPIFKWVISRY